MITIAHPEHSSCELKIQMLQIITDNLLYTDTQYNDKIRYHDNFTVTKPPLKRLQFVTKYVTK